MIQLHFGPKAAWQIVPHPSGDLLAVRLSAGRNAVHLQLATPIAAAIRDGLARAVKMAADARRLSLATQNGKPVALGEMVRKAVEGRANQAELDLLYDFVDRLGLTQ